MLNFDENMNKIVKEAYGNTDKFVRMGILSILFYVLTIYTIIDGFLALSTGFYPDQKNLTILMLSNASGDLFEVKPTDNTLNYNSTTTNLHNTTANNTDCSLTTNQQNTTAKNTIDCSLTTNQQNTTDSNDNCIFFPVSSRYHYICKKYG